MHHVHHHHVALLARISLTLSRHQSLKFLSIDIGWFPPCKACSFFKDMASYHRIITAKIWLNLRRKVDRTTTAVHYDWSLPNIRDIRDKIRSTSGDTRNTYCEWRIWELRQCPLKSGRECIPTKQRAKCRIPWETLVVRNKRTDVKIASVLNIRNSNSYPWKSTARMSNKTVSTSDEWTNSFVFLLSTTLAVKVSFDGL